MSQIPLNEEHRADLDQEEEGVRVVSTDLAYQRFTMVNAVYWGVPGGPWVLIDAGLPGSEGTIATVARERYGGLPRCIVLTHGHIDHVGALEKLAEEFDVPIYAHELEFPYLNGQAAYPPPDPGVGGGVMPMVATMLPRSPIDVSKWLRALPADGTIAEMPGWRWIHTPGHTPGHVSLSRDSDRTLIAGDAFITTNQESAYAVMVQKPELHGPPMYFTQDWEAAAESVRKLVLTEPDLILTGHGRAMRGINEELRMLARDFEEVAVPKGGRYVRHPARVEDGSAYHR